MAKHLDSTNISILAAVSFDVERTAPSSNFFKNVASILTYPYCPHQLFPDEIGCVKFISISKATKGKIGDESQINMHTAISIPTHRNP